MKNYNDTIDCIRTYLYVANKLYLVQILCALFVSDLTSEISTVVIFVIGNLQYVVYNLCIGMSKYRDIILPENPLRSSLRTFGVCADKAVLAAFPRRPESWSTRLSSVYCG
jgi:hypothetical protein